MGNTGDNFNKQSPTKGGGNSPASMKENEDPFVQLCYAFSADPQIQLQSVQYFLNLFSKNGDHFKLCYKKVPMDEETIDYDLS